MMPYIAWQSFCPEPERAPVQQVNAEAYGNAASNSDPSTRSGTPPPEYARLESLVHPVEQPSKDQQHPQPPPRRSTLKHLASRLPNYTPKRLYVRWQHHFQADTLIYLAEGYKNRVLFFTDLAETSQDTVSSKMCAEEAARLHEQAEWCAEAAQLIMKCVDNGRYMDCACRRLYRR